MGCIVSLRSSGHTSRKAPAFRSSGWKATASIITAASLVLAGCGSSKSSDEHESAPVQGGHLVDLQNFASGDPDHIDPALASSTQESQIAELLYDGLTKTGSDGVLHPAVAEAMEPNADATVWTFHLRSDVRFSDGTTVQPSDFKFAWERVLDPMLISRNADKFGVIKGYVPGGSTLPGVVVDDVARTLTVSLNAPDREFPALVSLPLFSPMPAETVGKLTDQSRLEQGLMVGNGAFAMAEPWAQGKSIKLARNDGYYGGPDNHKAYLDSLELRISKGVDAAYSDFQSGTGQVGRIPPGQFGEVQARDRSNLVNTGLLGTEYWGFNLNDATVGGAGNAKLRQAIALAINKRDIDDKVYNGSRQVASGWVPPGMPGYRAVDARQNDVSAAKQLLAEWGKTPPALRISFNAGAGHDEKAAIIRQNLAEIGIAATLDPLDNQSYGRAVRTGTLQFFRGAWNADFMSYDNFLYPLFHSASIDGDNVFGYRNVAFDGLVDRARAEVSDGVREDLYRQAERLMLDDQVVVPITWATAGLVKSDEVAHLTVEPLGYVDYAGAWLRD